MWPQLRLAKEVEYLLDHRNRLAPNEDTKFEVMPGNPSTCHIRATNVRGKGVGGENLEMGPWRVVTESRDDETARLPFLANGIS